MSNPGPSAASAAKEVSLYEKRRWIYNRSVDGIFNNLRWVMVVITQLVFYGLVWFDWNGRQAVLFHLVERKFYIFGMVFWPQDVIYLTVILILSAYGLFLVTAVAGRVFCGYACPQTVYTEVYMWIERVIEGDRAKRMKLDQSPWNGRKIGLKLAKHGLWLLVALWTGFTFVGYFTPMSELKHNIMTNTLGPWETWWIFFYGAFLYLMAGFMREQVCKYMCPYARFQSVMFDPDTLIITYDDARGEPRGARKKGTDLTKANLGHCVDCGICVQVCPTGIDIRKGLQYECIGCAACVDACNEVMDKVGYPRGLVRYWTENAQRDKLDDHSIKGHIARPRVLIYTGIMIVVTIIAGWFLAHRIPLKMDVLRDRSSLSRELEDGRIENTYMLRIMNTDEKPHTYTLKVTGLDGIEISGESKVSVPAATSSLVTLGARAPANSGKKGANTVYFDIEAVDNPDVKLHEKASFLQPQ